MDLERLAAAVGAVDVVGRAPVELSDLAYDTRAVTPGAAFFCVRGAHVDGHDFAGAAVAAGAAALVVERPLDVDGAAGRRHRRARGDGAGGGRVLRPPDRDAAGCRRHRDERQDDDRRAALRDPRGGGPTTGLVGRSRHASVASAAVSSARRRRRSTCSGSSARCSTPATARRDRGVVARVGAAPARPRSLRGARLHEPEPRAPRLPRGHGGLLPGEAAALPRRPAARRREHRRRVRPPARRGAAAMH